MGKASGAEQAVPCPAPATDGSSVRGVLCQHVGTVSDKVAVKCVLVLLLGIGVFLSAFFLLLSLRVSGVIPDDPDALDAEIQAGFILLKPASQLISKVRRLEEDIFRDVGVPNSKVSVTSLKQLSSEHSTYVTFSVLPDPRNASISAPSMNVLRTTLIGLALRQLNLSLTPSLFGDSFCLEMLGFPGGITVSPPQCDSNVYSREPLFNVTLHRTIHQVRAHLEELKDELRFTLELTPIEDLIVEMTNENGSTVTPPVTIQAFFLPNDSNIDLQTFRLKQLAQIIIQSGSRNLGLNPSMFGRIKDLKLSPFLQQLIPSCAPSPSPTPSPFRPPSSLPTTTNPHTHFSCPALASRRDAASPQRKLMRLPSLLIPPRPPTRLHLGAIKATLH